MVTWGLGFQVKKLVKLNEYSSLKSVELVCWSEKRFNDGLVLGILIHRILVAGVKLLMLFGS